MSISEDSRLESARCVDIGRLRAELPELKRRFHSASPFPQIVIDDFLNAPAAEAVLSEFHIPDDKAIFWRHYNENKRGLNRVELMGPTTQAFLRELSSIEFIQLLEEITGIPSLRPDPTLDGAGLHETKRGGFLNMHVDFLSHTLHRHWSRQLNLLLYLNKNWPESYNGFLEFWDLRERKRYHKIAPTFNRCIIFHTARNSWHGYPARLNCPEERSRKSIAVYYYREEPRQLKLRPTYYHALPSDPLGKKILVVLDRWALRAYSFVKRHNLISDDWASRLLRFFQ